MKTARLEFGYQQSYRMEREMDLCQLYRARTCPPRQHYFHSKSRQTHKNVTAFDEPRVDATPESIATQLLPISTQRAGCVNTTESCVKRRFDKARCLVKSKGSGIDTIWSLLAGIWPPFRKLCYMFPAEERKSHLFGRENVRECIETRT